MHRYLLFLVLVSSLPLVIPNVELVSQQRESGGIIMGRVVDAETGEALENANVFLSATTLGISTHTDGRFVLTNVPSGMFDLVASRVGYERQSITITVERAETLFYDIKLKPQPIQTPEMEVLGERVDETHPKLKYQFFPRDTASGAYCIYGTASTQPIGILFTDSAFYMYAIEPTVVDSEKYMRLWLLYRNQSHSPQDFKPATCCGLGMKGRKQWYAGIRPLPPVWFDSLKIAGDARSIANRYGEILKRWSLLHNQYQVERMREGGYLVSAEYYGMSYGGTVPQISHTGSPTTFYSFFQQSVNEGVLRRHIIYPNNSVNGYVYFPFPGLNWKSSGSRFPEATEYNYQIEITTPTGERRTVEFIPN